MKLFNYILLCALPLVFSCQENNLDKMGEPDKTIEKLSGTLHYLKEMKMWGIQYHYPGTIDSMDLYLIKETDEDFSFEEGKKVTVSGSCYLAGEVPFPVFAGETVYYIITTNLTYDGVGEPDKTIENVTGILHYSKEIKMWCIQYGYPGTIDSVDTYLIKETNKDFHFEEGKKVTVSGSCYLVEEAPFPVHAGETVYYIIITNLTDE